MSKMRLALVAFIAAFVGCHSTPLRAPHDLVDTSQNDWLKNYKQARQHQAEEKPQEACPLFRKLGNDKKFPAAKVAELRAWETCGEKNLSQLDRSQMPSYLQDLALDISLKLAQEQKDHAAEIELAFEKSKQRLPQAEKIRWTKLALERAQELKQEQKARELTKRLYSLAPRLNPEPLPKEYLAVAADYRMARQFNKAREYYDRVIHGKEFKLDDKISALKGLRLATKNERKKETHLEACARVVEFLQKRMRSQPKTHALRMASYDAHVYHARALWTQGRSSQARAIFEKLQRSMRGHLSLAELYWLQARMAEEENDFAKVGELLTKALKERLSEGGLRDKILWYSAWNERRQEHFTEAARQFADLSEKTQDEFIRVRALFWLGKSHSDAKKDSDAKVAFEKLIQLDPLGYYGLLAHRHLGLEISLKPAQAAVDGSGSQIPLDVTLAEWLHVTEERPSLTALLDEASQAYRKQSGQNDEGWVSLFKFYAKAGLYQKLYDSLAGLSPDRRRSVLESHPELLFPQPWNEQVKTASLQFGVKEELIYAIMRQESAFDPHARSVADAFGLLQVLPEVAEKLSTDNKLPYAQMEDLYDPSTNINIGAAHLKELLSSYKDQFILAVAAYNANDKAIKNWMKTRFRGDALEFIEEIPYEETRVYVRLVMRNLIFYSLLNSRSASIEFPSWLLKLDAT